MAATLACTVLLSSGVAVAAPSAASAWGGGSPWKSTRVVAASASKDAVRQSHRTGSWATVRAGSPARTLVLDPNGVLRATFTDGSRSVVLNAGSRRFGESTTSATVTTTSWVRLLPAPFSGAVDLAWVRDRLADTSADVLAIAMQYTTGAPELRDAAGGHLAGDASYGPVVDGSRKEGSDWNDYLGVRATYDGVVDVPESDQYRALDCSGFIRMVFGVRSGLPMTRTPDGVRLPRRAVQIATSAPGTVVVPNTGQQVKDFGALLAGDLVLFDAATDDGTDIDHVGIYLGRDSAGKPRFVSSRKTVDGPTMGDVGGRSRLDGTGLYATSFRSVRRL